MPYVNHCPGFQVQNDRQITMAFANGNLVDGDLPEVSERDVLRSCQCAKGFEPLTFGSVVGRQDCPKLNGPKKLRRRE